MRIIGHIDHPTMKITVFRMEDKLSVKFESGRYEQIYKFRDGEGMDSLEAVRAWADPVLLAEAEQLLQRMHQMKITALGRLHPQEADEAFEEII